MHARVFDPGLALLQFANPQGNAPALDPLSDTKMWFPLSLGAEKDREKQLLERLGVENNFKNPRRFADITDQELGRYAGVFLPGGHAPMTDLWNDKDLGRILLHFHNQAKPTGGRVARPGLEFFSPVVLARIGISYRKL